MTLTDEQQLRLDATSAHMESMYPEDQPRSPLQ